MDIANNRIINLIRIIKSLHYHLHKPIPDLEREKANSFLSIFEIISNYICK